METSRYNQNDFSYWFEKIKNCGIRVPKTLIFKTPEQLYDSFYMENPDVDMKKVKDWVEKEVIPLVRAEGMHLIFIKNARFSNKFTATDCMVTPYSIPEHLMNLNYAAMVLGAGGLSELIVRERIGHDRKNVPCIYEGLPLRTEFRVFYDFDTKQVIYTANYWDYTYVASSLYNKTDKIIFDSMKDTIYSKFEQRKDEVEALVSKHMQEVEGLEGKWSIDILEDDSGNLWLIDMAVAEMSSYWDESKVN